MFHAIALVLEGSILTNDSLMNYNEGLCWKLFDKRRYHSLFLRYARLSTKLCVMEMVCLLIFSGPPWKEELVYGVRTLTIMERLLIRSNRTVARNLFSPKIGIHSQLRWSL